MLQPSANAPEASPVRPFTTNHSVRVVLPAFRQPTVLAERPLPQRLAPAEFATYEAGSLLSLQNTLCWLSKELESRRTKMEEPGWSSTWNLAAWLELLPHPRSELLRPVVLPA